jgi:hypothetical protein
MTEDGNCLFRAVADQVYGDSELYDLVRQMSVDYMVCYCCTNFQMYFPLNIHMSALLYHSKLYLLLINLMTYLFDLPKEVSLFMRRSVGFVGLS